MNNWALVCRNVSSDGAEARQRLRECEGLVDALLHALQTAVVTKDTDNKVHKDSSKKKENVIRRRPLRRKCLLFVYRESPLNKQFPVK